MLHKVNRIVIAEEIIDTLGREPTQTPKTIPAHGATNESPVITEPTKQKRDSLYPVIRLKNFPRKVH